MYPPLVIGGCWYECVSDDDSRSDAVGVNRSQSTAMMVSPGLVVVV